LNPAPPTDRPLSPALAGLLLALVITAAYLTSFRGVFVFDDLLAIVDNPTIRDLHHPAQVLLAPAEGGTIGGRPVVNLTLALNHALGGLAPGGYHAVNLLIHALAGLTLFGLVRCTLLRRPRFAADALPLALAVAALWALHPLQTAAVTYIVQRAESLMGLFYLLTLYCFVRSVDSPAPRRWQVAAFTACLLGMGTKEVMASAPLLVLLYDRTFVAGSWREAWRQRGRFHGALLGTWLLLALLVLRAENRGGSAGFGTAVTWWDYACTQCVAITHYLRLALWPQPLVFDYGTPLYRSLAAVAPQAGLLLLLLGATVWALARKPALGFLGAWFFLILAPSSSLVPVATQTMAEHRLYLPLAAVVLLLGLAAHLAAGRRAVIVLLALAAAAGVLTARRNLVYHSELALWTDTVAHRPENPRAHTNLGIALAEAGRLPEAAVQLEESLRLQPDNAATRLNLCDVLTRLGRPADAVPHGEAAVQLEPGSVAAHLNLAQALAALGRNAEAVTHYETVLLIEPGAPEVPGRLAAALYALGNQAASASDFAGAIARYRRALALSPDYLPARNNLANALLVTGGVDEAITHYRELLRRNPGDRHVQENLAQALELSRARRP
jgi:tetratricopeptide (TPR) repeat protein